MAGPARERTPDVRPADKADRAPAAKAPATKPPAPGGLASPMPSPAVAAAILKGSERTARMPPKAAAKKPRAAPTALAGEKSPARVKVEPAKGVAPPRPITVPEKPRAVAPALTLLPKSAAPIAGPATAKPAAPAATPPSVTAAPPAAAAKAAPVAPAKAGAPATPMPAAAPAAMAPAAAGPAAPAATPGAAAVERAATSTAPDTGAETQAPASTTPEGGKAAGGAAAPTKPAGEKGGGGKAEGKDAKAGAEGEAADEGGGAGAAAGAAGVTLHIPEPPTEPSPSTAKRIAGVQKRAGGAAAAQGALPPASDQVGDARKAVTEPDAEALAKAQADLINQVQAAPSPEIVKLCERIREVIRKKRPPDEDALMEAKPEGEALNAGNQLNSTVEGEAKKVEGNYAAVNNPPAAGTPAQGADLPPQPDAAGTAPVNAKAATPDAVPPGNVSLDADAADSKKKMQDAGMETPAAQLVQSGPVAEARGAQGELDQAAKEDPAKVLAGQKEALAKAEGDMAALQAQALASLTASRAATVKSTSSKQEGMVGSEEQQRAKAGADAKKIFDDAKTQVQALLQPLASNAMAEWEAAKEVLVSNFKADLAVVQKRVEERHSGVGGFVVGLWDAVAGLPDWAEEAYTKAETNFGDGVIAKLMEISTKVNAIIAACDLIITNARDAIAKVFAALPESLKSWAAGEQEKLNGQLDGLHNEVIAARDNFNKDLVERSSAAVDEVRAQIAELRKKAGGLVGRIVNAVNRFLEDPVKFIIEGLLELLGIPPAAFWAVVAKIKKVVKDIADDPMKFANNLLKGLAQGFSQFFDNILSHLLKGFISWLTGSLGDVGVQLPKDASLKSIITFFLQLMGITWPRIRKILVKHVGEKNVALVEKVYRLISFLIEKGPEGIFEMIKEKLDPQSIVDQVVQLAVDFLISAVIKAVTPRIIALFNPAGAIIQALEAIYRVLKWIFQNAARIFTLVETVVNGVADILAGSIGGFANAVEKALGMLIAPVISFIADYLGFGDLPDKIAKKIASFQEWILGMVEKVIVFFIEKGKALLAALGLGGKKDEKKGGKAEEEIGETVEFEADGEPHRLWIDASGTNATLMVASTEQTLDDYLTYVERYAKGDLKTKASQAKQLAANADIDADEIAKLAAHDKEQDDSAADTEMTKRQAKLKGDEKKLAQLLTAIFEAMQPIKPRLGKPVDDITREPYGYDLRPDRGTFEYGEAYEYTEIQRASGFGSADEALFPPVHVNENGLVKEGHGILRADWEVIHRYESVIAGVEDKLDDDGAPKLAGSPYGPSNQLRAGGKKDRSFNRGVRKQMEGIVKAIENGTKITGIEVVVGERRVDYTTKTRVGRKEVAMLVEYKHWTGKLDADRRSELANKLESQLKGQITGGRGNYAMLLVQWPAFGQLDDTSQAVFEQVIGDVTEFGQERGVVVRFER